MPDGDVAVLPLLPLPLDVSDTRVSASADSFEELPAIPSRWAEQRKRF